MAAAWFMRSCGMTNPLKTSWKDCAGTFLSGRPCVRAGFPTYCIRYNPFSVSAILFDDVWVLKLNMTEEEENTSIQPHQAD